jgi:hypothetical protein
MFRTLFFCIAVLWAVNCDNPSGNGECTPFDDDETFIELISPSGGEVFDVGDIVPVSWKVNPDVVPQVILQVSTGGDAGPWRNVFDKGIGVPTGGDVVCMDTVWRIGSEDQEVSYGSSGTVTFRVGWYDEPALIFDIADMITVNR